jgi:hypothetical protein
VLAVQATTTAQDRILELFVSNGDCSKGSIELRLDCLTRKVEHIEARLDGRYGEVVPLGPDVAPARPPLSPRVMPPWPPLPDQPLPPAQPPPLPAQPPLSTLPK